MSSLQACGTEEVLRLQVSLGLKALNLPQPELRKNGILYKKWSLCDRRLNIGLSFLEPLLGPGLFFL
jgi:hypothetical protein